MNESLKKNAIHNLFFSFSAQLVSVILSTLMALVVPKILGENDYAYWQLFIFYSNYVGFFHFGITDGMYLKNGGIDYKDLKRKEISSQFYSLLIIQLIILIGIVLSSVYFISDPMRKMIIIYTAIYMIIANLNWFLGYLFQATNRVKKYSISVMIDKIIFMLFIIFVFIFKFKYINVYIPFFIFTTFCALIYSIINNREIVFCLPLSIKQSIKLSFDSAKVGINLTLASVSSLLILGVGRFLVDREWGIESFGKFSFALSLTNFFLLFIAQVSVVLFPTLRKVNIKTAKELFQNFNLILDAFLPIIFVLYIPIKILLGLWLPQYKVSLDYLALLLPICIFDGKNQMINNTYFKVLRQERKLLIVNLITLVLSTILSLISVYIIKDIYYVIITMLIAVAFRSIIGEKILYKILRLKNNINKTFAVLVYSIMFIIVSTYFKNEIAFMVTLGLFIIYMITCKTYYVYFEAIKMLIKKVKKNSN